MSLPALAGASVADLAAGVRARRFRARELWRGLPRPDRPARSAAGQLPAGRRRRGPAAGRRGRRADRGGRGPGAARRGAGRAQGHLRDPRARHHLRLAHPARASCRPTSSTAAARLAAAGGGLPGQAQHGRVRHGLVEREQRRAGRCATPGTSSGCRAARRAARRRRWRPRCARARLGTDTGGSIRQPAALCGVVGLKPTYGRVSRYGVVAFASSLDHPGPMGRTVEDVAALLEVIAGHDPLDATSIDAPVGAYRAACAARGVAGCGSGVPAEYFQAGMDPEVEAAVRAAHRRSRAGAGDQLVPVSLPHTRYAISTYYLVCTAEASSNLARYDGIRYGHRAGGGSRSRSWSPPRAARGSGPRSSGGSSWAPTCCAPGTTRPTTARRCGCGALIADDFRRAFASCDALLTPDLADGGVQARGEGAGRPAADVPGRHLHGERAAGRGAGAVPVLRLHPRRAADRAADHRRRRWARRRCSGWRAPTSA